jgi:hypothetical protein
MSAGFAFHTPSRISSGPAGRVTWAAVVLTVGSVLLFTGCAGSAATSPPAATTGPTQAATAATEAPTTAATEAPTTAATAAPPTIVSTVRTTPAPGTAVPAGGSIVFAPSTVSCSDSETTVTITWTLAPGTSGDQTILFEWDGSLGQGGQVPKAVSTAGFTQQSNGSWRQTENTTGFDLCSSLGLTAGRHTWSVVQAKADGAPGPVMAQGAFTVTQ